MVDSDIRIFWEWFSASSCVLANLVEEGSVDEIVRVVAPRINALRLDLGWEVGPGMNAPYAFSFTLNGNKENIPNVEALVRLNPGIEGWEINIGRPPKRWDGHFSMSNGYGQEVWIESRNWKYYLTAFNNFEFFDVSLIGDHPSMDAASLEQAGHIIVQAILGELMTLEKVDRVAFIDKPSSDELARSSSINNLKDHINSLLQMR